ncbi:MAG: hypothetical protein QW334_00315 [Thermofilum sp.]
MYEDAKTWNPYVGCLHKCVYCVPSFQRLLKRSRCEYCRTFTPHYHPERLAKIPNAKIVFVSGFGDIAFCPFSFLEQIIERVNLEDERNPKKLYYFQSKDPIIFRFILQDLPSSVILLTTLETNRDEDYERFSRAPYPSKRYMNFLKLDYPRKVVTIEPIMDFDLGIFRDWVLNIEPEYVWIGYNSRSKHVRLPEPPLEKTLELIAQLEENGVKVKRKLIRSPTH